MTSPVVLWAGRTNPLKLSDEKGCGGETITNNFDLVALDVYEKRTKPENALLELHRLYEGQCLHRIEEAVRRATELKQGR